MKKITTLLLAAFLVSGLATGCKPKTEEKTEPEVQQPAEQPAAEPEVVEEETTEEVEEEPSEEEENIIDEAMFIKAAYEVSCVKAKIDNPEEQKEILTVIYPRYGFETVEDFTEAESSLKDSTSVKAAIESKMESCTVEAARGFKTAGAAEQAEGEQKEEAQEDTKKAAPKAAYKDMVYNASLDSQTVESGKVICAVSRGTASCRVSGLFEGKPLTLQGRGDVSKSGSFKINLKAGNNTGVVQGEFKNSSGRGSFSGTIFSKPHSGSWSSR